jgi:hypothetical protein
MRATANPFLLNFSFLGNNREIVPGSSPELCISIKNRGDQDVVVDLSIEVTDQNSKALSEWVSPRRVRLALNAAEDKTVSFHIQIPENAWAYDYRYDVILDSLDHYSEYTPLIYPQILKVIPAPVILKHGGEDSAFFLTPVTSSAEPKKIKPGETFEVEALIENRTKLVDRYYLICSDLKPEYFSVSYPEIKNQYGLIVESDGLELNPGKQAKATIRFHPPYNAEAGNYYPTIRLASINNPRSNLLDIVYIHIPPTHSLELEIDPIKDRLKEPKTESGEYQLKINNQGNVERNLLVKGHNQGWGGLTFSIDPEFRTLAPGARSQVHLLVKPIGRWWNRPFFGVGREFKFGVELEDMRGLPLPAEFPEAKLTWEPYPRKWMILVIILLSLLAVGGTVAITMAIWNAFFKQPPGPKITELAPTKAIFREARNETIKLDWTVQNAKSLGKLVLNQAGPDGSEVKTFDFTSGIPTDLSLKSPTQTDNYCDFKSTKQDKTLVCRGIVTSARKPGQYQFDLQLFDKKELQKQISSIKTDTVRIAPAGLPNITEFISPQSEYFLGNPPASSPPVLLNWDIGNPSQVDKLKLVGIAQDGTSATQMQEFEFQNSILPQSLKPLCKLGTVLSCRNIQVHVKKPGLYTFRLSVESKQGDEIKTITKVTDAVRIKSIPTVTIPAPLKPSTVPQIAVPTPAQSQKNSQPPRQPAKPPAQAVRETFSPSPLPISDPKFYPVQPVQPSPSVSLTYQQSIQQANDIANGLIVANNAGRIKPNSSAWRNVQEVIASLRQGLSLEDAAQQSQTSMGLLNTLMAWGQGRQLPTISAPQRTTSPQQPTVRSSSNMITVPPEPLWGNARPSTGVSSRKSDSIEPLR